MTTKMDHIFWSIGHQLRLDNIVESDDCYVIDSEGKRFVDLESGVWCTSVGHNNIRVNNAITSQINRIAHTGFCYCNPLIEESAGMVLEITGIGNGRCEFLCSGSEAIEFGMRAARDISDKPLALAFSDSYFGAYGDAAVKDENKWFIYDRLNCGCADSEAGCIGECDNFRNIPFDKIGIFLFEPGSSSGLVRFPSEELIALICSKVRNEGGIIMANEITTGIGRTGKWFGYQHYNIVPDIVAIGKGIGNGYPVSVTAISGKLAEKVLSSGFKYAQSHQNDPLGARVVIEVISIIKEHELIAKSSENGDYLRESLSELKSDVSLIKDIRGRGMMIAIELKREAARICDEMRNHGFIVAWRPNTEVLRIDPPLTIEKQILDRFISIFKGLVQ